MQYYDEARQYNHLFEDTMKFPTKTCCTSVKRIKSKKALSMISGREHTVDISKVPYADQK